MFRQFGFFNYGELSPYESCSKLAEIRLKIESLREKRNELYIDAKKEGRGSVAELKHDIIHKLLLTIELHIAEFNHATVFDKRESGTENLINFIKKLDSDIYQLGVQSAPVLSLPRNENQRKYNLILDNGNYAVSVVGLGIAYCYPSIPTLAVAFVCGFITASGKKLPLTAFQLEGSESMRHILRLRELLLSVGESLGLEKTWRIEVLPSNPENSAEDKPEDQVIIKSNYEGSVGHLNLNYPDFSSHMQLYPSIMDFGVDDVRSFRNQP